MIILGLGSNLGDRLNHLRRALRAIAALPEVRVTAVAPIYYSNALLPDNAPSSWDLPFLNTAVSCETTLTPHALLAALKKIETTLGREQDVKHWGPRVVDIDILVWDDLVIHNEPLTIPHARLFERPFALWPLADIAPLWICPPSGPYPGKTAAQIVEMWGSRFSGKAPLQTRQLFQRIDSPQLVGVINVTPDSFSDGGHFQTAEAALQQALYLIATGAEIIDIGAESTAPNTALIDSTEEWRRLEPVLTHIQAAKNHFLIPPKISIDTRHADVAAKALALNVDWINDVTGLQDPAMRELIQPSQADCVVMHHTSLPASRHDVLPRHINPIDFIYEWGARRLDELEQAGIHRSRIIFDPGIGFGKAAEHSLLLLKHVKPLQALGTRLLIGHSRKSFFSLFTPHPFAERDVETLTAALYLANQGVDYLRVHNVEWCARGFSVNAALTGSLPLRYGMNQK